MIRPEQCHWRLVDGGSDQQTARQDRAPSLVVVITAFGVMAQRALLLARFDAPERQFTSVQTVINTLAHQIRAERYCYMATRVVS